MYPLPVGPNLTEEQRQELDDTFLSSNPFEYFKSRIGMLLRWADIDACSEEPSKITEVNQKGTADPQKQFTLLLGRPTDFTLETSLPSIITQVATDAYAVRHHAAESLVRLTAAILQQANNNDLCIWEALSTGPTQLRQVVEQINKYSTSEENSMQFPYLVICEKDLSKGMSTQLTSTCNVFANWLQHAANLLVGETFHLNSAHNKVKHGLAVRARNDLKISLLNSPPNTDGTIPVSAFAAPGALDIFDRPVIEVLARAPKVDNHQQGLELTQLRIDVPSVLAETYMIAWTHGAMFHNASAKHFTGRTGLPDHLHAPSHPGYPVDGPHPTHISGKAPLGMRFPLTTPPDGSPIRRPAGIAFPDYFVPLKFTETTPFETRIVADTPTDEA